MVDLVGLPFGALLFLGAAWLMLTGTITTDSGDPFEAFFTRFIAPIFFGFFGLLMASGVPAALRRGLRRTILKVGPGGMWTPEMGALSWDEIADVRFEAVDGFSGNHTNRIRTYHRLGIVPRDEARRDAVHRGLTWRMLQFMEAVTRTVRPGSRFRSVDDLAPFGVFAYELEDLLEDVVDVIRQYREVSGAPAAARSTA